MSNCLGLLISPGRVFFCTRILLPSPKLFLVRSFSSSESSIEKKKKQTLLLIVFGGNGIFRKCYADI